MDSVYLDNNATTKIDDRVFAAMRPYLTNHFAHPSSPHLLGTKVREKIEQARNSVAVLLGTSHPDEIVFTSGGTESINTAIKGVLAAAPTGNHVLTTKVEHISVLNLCRSVANHHYRITYLPVDRGGMLNLMAMGLTAPEAFSSIRFGLSRYNIEAEIDYVISVLTMITKNLKTEASLSSTAFA